MWLVIAAAAAGCANPAREPLAPQVSGTLAVPGLAAAVRIVRDRAGIPHIYASTREDLFLAQGFVQAQDRLFQIDLWRRASLGRLSEVLGVNFTERDAMTRRVQYWGDRGVEWASYGPDARPAAEAFVRGVNAWIAMARERPPEAFALAGWKPEPWTADDLLNRTDAFVADREAIAAAARVKYGDVVGRAIGRVGVAPFFVGLSARLPASAWAVDYAVVSPGSDVPEAPPVAASAGGVLTVAESAARYAHPAARYLVHLAAPGWNVIGAAAPWRPGVAIGHNDRLAWGVAPMDDDVDAVNAGAAVDDIPIDPTATIVRDAIVVKGRPEPVEYETAWTARGVVIATDRAGGRNFVLRWRGNEPGWAPELAAIAIDRATTAEEFRAAAGRWKGVRLVLSGQASVAQDFSPAAPGSGADASEATLKGRPTTGRPTTGRPTTGRATTDRATTDRATTAIFTHPLGITAAARARYNVGPIARPRDDQSVRLLFDTNDWDASHGIVTPGQSESPDSRHFADLAKLWSAGALAPLPFSDAAVQANAESTLTLVPARRSP